MFNPLKVLVLAAILMSVDAHAAIKEPAMTVSSSPAQEIKIADVVDFRSSRFYFQNGTAQVGWGIATIDGRDQRSLIVFSENKINAYSLQKVDANDSISLFKPDAAASGPTLKVLGHYLKVSKSNCETAESKAVATVEGDRLVIKTTGAATKFCRTGTLVEQILDQDDHVTVSGKILRPDYSNPKMGKAYCDETGMVWSRLQTNEKGDVLLVTSVAEAEKVCASIDAELPSVKDVERLQSYLFDYTRPHYQIPNGGVVYPYSTLTKQTYEAALYGVNSGQYDLSPTDVLPGLYGFGLNLSYIYTADPQTVWGTQYNQIVPRSAVSNLIFKAGTVCVQSGGRQ